MDMHGTALANDPMAARAVCRVCGSATLRLARKGNLPAALDAIHFQITDKSYGRTADLYQCVSCGFRQSSTLKDVIRFYEKMDDAEYEDTRDARLLQARKLLNGVAPYCSSGRLIDIGAGTGILVEQALACGFQAEGIEPSRPLFERARARGLPLYHGVLPANGVKGPYDVATIVDVIEHVETPVELLKQTAEILSANGLVMVVTPDVDSLAARLLGKRWWHYRIAHIGYFNRTTLALALSRAGLTVVSTLRPAWYFPANYLAERVMVFAPRAMRFRPPTFLNRLTIPLNLLDSLAVIARKTGDARGAERHA